MLEFQISSSDKMSAVPVGKVSHLFQMWLNQQGVARAQLDVLRLSRGEDGLSVADLRAQPNFPEVGSQVGWVRLASAPGVYTHVVGSTPGEGAGWRLRLEASCRLATRANQGEWYKGLWLTFGLVPQHVEDRPNPLLTVFGKPSEWDQDGPFLSENGTSTRVNLVLCPQAEISALDHVRCQHGYALLGPGERRWEFLWDYAELRQQQRPTVVVLEKDRTQSNSILHTVLGFGEKVRAKVNFATRFSVSEPRAGQDAAGREVAKQRTLTDFLLRYDHQGSHLHFGYILEHGGWFLNRLKVPGAAVLGDSTSRIHTDPLYWLGQFETMAAVEPRHADNYACPRELAALQLD